MNEEIEVRGQRKLTERNLMLTLDEANRSRDNIEDFEVISSSRETEYSVSPYPH